MSMVGLSKQHNIVVTYSNLNGSFFHPVNLLHEFSWHWSVWVLFHNKANVEQIIYLRGFVINHAY